jgi:hypothetical protein
MTTDELRAKIAKEQADLETFVQQCNQQASFRNGRIEAMQEDLAEREAAAQAPIATTDHAQEVIPEPVA